MTYRAIDLDPAWLRAYVVGSNEIEGIKKPENDLLREVLAFEQFLQCDSLGTHELLLLLRDVQPRARLRSNSSDGVVVGSHVAPPGGKQLVLDAAELLICITNADSHPVFSYAAWQHLHPLTDGNGRTGRMLYAWQCIRKHGRTPRDSFLEDFHYQMLSVFDKATGGKGWRSLLAR